MVETMTVKAIPGSGIIRKQTKIAADRLARVSLVKSDPLKLFIRFYIFINKIPCPCLSTSHHSFYSVWFSNLMISIWSVNNINCFFFHDSTYVYYFESFYYFGFTQTRSTRVYACFLILLQQRQHPRLETRFVCSCCTRVPWGRNESSSWLKQNALHINLRYCFF
jgi:hypothetical protein